MFFGLSLKKNHSVLFFVVRIWSCRWCWKPENVWIFHLHWYIIIMGGKSVQASVAIIMKESVHYNVLEQKWNRLKKQRVNKKVSASFCGTKLQYDFKKKLNLLWLFKHFMYKQKPRDNQDKEFTIVCFLCIKCVFHNLYYLKNCVIYSSQFHLKPFLYKVIKMIYKCI